MCLNLYDYQSKENRYSYGSTCLKTKVSRFQNHTIESQKSKRKELKHNTIQNHQIKKGKTKRKNEQRRTTKSNGKQGLKWQ